MIDKHLALARDKNVFIVFLAFLNDSGYLKHISKQNEQKKQEDINYLNQFKKTIERFEVANDQRDTKSFLQELQMEIDAGEQGALPIDFEAGPEAIKVMTAHGAKGLEFEHVFVVNMVDKRFPTTLRKEPILIPDALIKEILPEGDIHLEEERRLFYVAMTRAKSNLYFSWAPDYGGMRKKKPSRFLDECKLVVASKTKKTKGIDLLSEKKINIDQPADTNISVPSYFSYTQLTAFKNCPYQYYFAHILKVPTRGKYVFSFGQAMHLTLQKIFERLNEKQGLGQKDLFGEKNANKEKINISLDEILEIYEDSWIDDWYEADSNKKKYKKKGKEILKEFYKKFKNDWPKVVSLEQGVNLKIGGRRIYGKIDRVDALEKGIQIVDYKTGRPKKEDKIDIDDKEQLLIYQLAAGQAMDKEICNLQFYYLDDNSEVNFLGTERDLKEMEEKILERIDKIEDAAKTGKFIPKPGPLCSFCDFREICEYRKI